jgi:hypothetical protein
LATEFIIVAKDGLTPPVEYAKNELMDYFYFVLIILALVAIMYFLIRAEKGIKIKYKKAAYGLLEKARPEPKEIIDTIKGLRLYGGRWFRDKECSQLVNRLQIKYESLENKVTQLR